ncbi:hypothetical protein PV11_08471 [Exophiala sideris]|uniref:4-coumarate-CoA ligase n=1 Tax=Exophiala sideris TaxID=1016849 RepID=A0A0D1YDG6_9EURO|nr:hypothetical protein PV11_08471 [Exophiala sideris]
MPHKSIFPDVTVPDCDLWSFLCREPQHFKGSQVIYRDLKSSCAHTFSDVCGASQKFGHCLITRWRWKKGQIFAVYSPNHIDISPLMLGILFAGGVVTPSNPDYNVNELAYQLKDSGASAIATTEAGLPVAREAADRVGIPNRRIILIDKLTTRDHAHEHWTKIRQDQLAPPTQSSDRPQLDADKDLAFLVYSSGTTGLPKGVMLSHRNVISDLLLIEGAVGQWYSKPTTKILSVLPFYHIYGLTGLVLQPLHRGIESIVMTRFQLTEFLHAIQTHQITFTYVAPPVIVKMARDPIVADYDLRSLEMITSGGAPLSSELIETIHRKFQIKINQAYGLSETSPMTHTQPWIEWHSSIGSIGKLFPNMTAKLMTADAREVKVREVGELWLSGPNVFKGYWRNDMATSESITHDGFFKTGDIGYVDESHNFFITDRVKELIKYQGFQVAPAELEGKLMDHPDILDVAVVGVYDDFKATELCRAYIVPRDGKGTTEDAEAIIRWLAQRVVYYKRLSGGVRFLKEIPKSASGKILRRLLKEQAKQETQSRLDRARL